jgi:hypothetical protein
MITKCMLRPVSGMNNSSETNLASGGGSEFSDSSSSVSIEDLPPTTFSTTGAPSGLLAFVTSTIPSASSGGRSRMLNLSTGGMFSSNDSTTMMTLMEASDCDDFTGDYYKIHILGNS